ncbi:hypothetical protein EYF80_040894 [Liparis tanakae]|uniref:Uncharacterized protein n=1 Tax=Liparis tanakae TaxID=230148 RepID=A0A4Z2G8K1_9TELE|nr:hypothetical protein EYF80_040894 [Liparis tanakae]
MNPSAECQMRREERKLIGMSGALELIPADIGRRRGRPLADRISSTNFQLQLVSLHKTKYESCVCTTHADHDGVVSGPGGPIDRRLASGLTNSR